MVEVYTTDNPVEADLIRNMIQSTGIRCVIEGENQGGLTGLGIMVIRLYVRLTDRDQARKLIDGMDDD